MKNIFLLLTILLLPLFLVAQEPQTIMDQASKAVESGDLEAAHNNYVEAAKLYKNSSNWQKYLDCGVQMTNNLINAGEYGLGIEKAQEFIDIADQTKQTKDISLSLLYKNLGKIYYIQDQYKKALPFLEQALFVRKKIDSNDPELARDYGNLGIISRFANRYKKAIEYLQKALTLQDDPNVLARLYSELGTNYKLSGNLRKSVDNQNLALNILQQQSDDYATGVALLEKGSTLTALQRNGEDRQQIKDALRRFNQSSVDAPANIVACYQQIGSSYLLFAESTSNSFERYLDSAQVYYEKAQRVAEQKLPPNSIFLANVYLNLSSVATQKQNFEAATNYLNQYKAIIAIENATKGMEAYDLHGATGKIYKKQERYKEALDHFHAQVRSLINDYHKADATDLPSLDQLKTSISHNYMTEALALKARCWYLYYKQDKNQDYLNHALTTIRLFDELINHVRADFANSGSNIAWSAMTLDAYENAIEICLALAEATGDNNYKEQAFYYSEKSKSLSLLEAFQNTKANSVAGLSAEVLKKEREMKLDISDLEQEVFQLEQERKPALQETIEALKKKIFLKRETYQDFQKDLELNNPQYYNTKYNYNILNLEQIRALLKDEQGIIEYFIGESHIYAFKITKTEFETYILDGQESMKSRVKDLRESIYGFFLSSRDHSEQIKSKYAQQYSDRAYKMYQKLIEPLGPLPRRLIIIPTGPMSDMPFEPLLTQEVSNPDSYKEHPYFVRDHAISYCYSATLLKEMVKRTHQPTKGVYAGFAPYFGESSASLIRGKRFALSPLAYNKPEIENIQEMLEQGVVFKDEAATEEQFKQIASDYSILHFATHGMANSNDPDYSLLAFTEIEDDKENEFLYVSDLYNLELNADMVVLSACETALGKNFKGEGITSMARGFSYAGAKSIFTTLWSVNDHSTYNIIQGFYHYLQQGMDKDEALQQSKLNYLKHANNLTTHPFLWSPYILVGDTNGIEAIQKGFPWVYIFGGLMLLGVLGLLGQRFIKKKELA